MSRRKKEQPPKLTVAEISFQYECLAADACIGLIKNTLSAPEWSHWSGRCAWCKRAERQGHRDDCRGVHLRALFGESTPIGIAPKEWLS